MWARDWRAVGHNAERRKWVRRDAVARWLVLPAGQPTPALRVRSAEGDEEKICGDDEKRKSAASRKVIDETEMGSDRIISQSSGLYTHSPAQT